LKAKEKNFAIICDSSEGPNFCDVRVHDDCNTDTCNCLTTLAALTRTTPACTRELFSRVRRLSL
jgi:hypothetical protein